jgi:hypothetical protein
MTVTNQDASIYRGDSAKIFVAVTAADGTPLDQTVDATYQYRMSPTSHTPDVDCLIKKELGAGLSLATGGVNVALSSIDTDQPPGIYYHELKVYNAGDVSTAMVGAFIIRKALQLGSSVQPSSANLGLARGTPSRTP